MQIYFIRHAQSENNHLYDINGPGSGRSEDPDLTKKGEKQLKYLQRFLSKKTDLPLSLNGKDYQNRTGFRFTHLYASPMVRAVKTGWAVANQFNLPLQLWIDLHEGGGIFLNNEEEETGNLPGKTSEYFIENFPGILLDKEISQQGWWNKPFEPWEGRPLRAERVWEFLLTQHGPDDRIALFSHGGFYNHWLSVILGSVFVDKFSLKEKVFFELNNTGITRIDVDNEENKFRIYYNNKIDFLPDDLIT